MHYKRESHITFICLKLHLHKKAVITSQESFRSNHTVNVLQNSYSMLIYANFIKRGNFCPPEDQQASHFSALAYQTADITQRNMSDHALPYEMHMKCKQLRCFSSTATCSPELSNRSTNVLQHNQELYKNAHSTLSLLC